MANSKMHIGVAIAAIGFGAVGAVGAVAVAVAVAVAQDRQPPCFFMECGPANTPNPTPAQPPKLTPIVLKPGVAANAFVERPRIAGETCATSNGFTYCVSSVLAPQSGNTYGPANLFDGRLETAWVEGKPGHGAGEWIVVELAAPIEVGAVQLLNGYHKNRDAYLKNSRVRGLKVTLSNGFTTTAELADRDGIQEIKLPPGQKIRWVQLTLQSAYPGTKFADTAISELRLIAAQP